MITEVQEKQIVDSVEKKLDRAARERDIHLKIQGSKREEEWLYITVSPARAGERASDHADLMAEIEKELEEEDSIENVLLVPTVPE